MKHRLFDGYRTTPVLSLVLSVALGMPGHATEFENTASKSVVKSVAVTEGTNMSATVSPDHKTIIIDLQETLWSLPITGATAKRLTDPLLEPARPTGHLR